MEISALLRALSQAERISIGLHGEYGAGNTRGSTDRLVYLARRSSNAIPTSGPQMVHGEKLYFKLVLVLLYNQLIFSAINSGRNVGQAGIEPATNGL